MIEMTKNKITAVLGPTNTGKTHLAIETMLSFESGITGNIHLDYFQKPPKRSIEIVGSKGRIEFDYYLNRVILYTHDDMNGKVFSVDVGINQLHEKSTTYLLLGSHRRYHLVAKSTENSFTR